MIPKAIVIDLDGTLININSFKSYIIYILKETIKSINIHLFSYTIFWVLLRKCRCISHEKMKFHILQITNKFMTQHRLQHFTLMYLLPNINNEVHTFCKQYQAKGYYIYLSTAAPENYVKELFPYLNFDGYCASPMPQKKEKNWKENIRKQKYINTCLLLKKTNTQLAIMITDHYDDLPLLEIPKEKNILVNPNNKTISILHSHHIDFQKKNKIIPRNTSIRQKKD